MSSLGFLIAFFTFETFFMTNLDISLHTQSRGQEDPTGHYELNLKTNNGYLLSNLRGNELQLLLTTFSCHACRVQNKTRHGLGIPEIS